MGRGVFTISNMVLGLIVIPATVPLMVGVVTRRPTTYSAIASIVSGVAIAAFIRFELNQLSKNAGDTIRQIERAMAEAERYFPELLQKIEALAMRHGIVRQAIVMRMTGCPNGCARPYVAEVGLIGKGPGPVKHLFDVIATYNPGLLKACITNLIGSCEGSGMRGCGSPPLFCSPYLINNNGFP